MATITKMHVVVICLVVLGVSVYTAGAQSGKVIKHTYGLSYCFTVQMDG